MGAFGDAMGQTAASSIGATATGALTGLINGAINYHYSKKMANLNYNLNEKAADNAYQRQLEYYDATQSAAAKLKQIKDAGLSPSVMASGGIPQGGGGATQGNGGAGMGLSSIVGQSTAPSVTELAQARLMNAQADQIEGKNERGKAEITQILADAGMKEAAKALSIAQKDGQEIANYINGNTKDAEIRRISYLAETQGNEMLKTFQEYRQKELEANFQEDTYNTRVQYVSAEMENLVKDTLLKQKDIDLKQAEIDEIAAQMKKWTEEIAQGWRKLVIETTDVNNRAHQINNQTKYWNRQIKAMYADMTQENKRAKWANEVQTHGQTLNFWGGIIQSAIVGISMIGSGALKGIPLSDLLGWGKKALESEGTEAPQVPFFGQPLN